MTSVGADVESAVEVGNEGAVERAPDVERGTDLERGVDDERGADVER